MIHHSKNLLTLLILWGSTVLANDTYIPLRLYMPTAPKIYSMTLWDKEKNKPVSKEIFAWVAPFKKVGTRILAKAANLENKIGFINPQGEWVVPAVLDKAKDFSEDAIARVRIGKKWGYVRSDGSWLLKPTLYYVLPFRHGFGIVTAEKHGGVYFVDIRGKTLADTLFSDARSFCSDGTASVAVRHTIPLYEIHSTGVTQKETQSKQEFWGKIDRNGTIVIPLTLSKNDPKLKCQEVKQKQKQKKLPAHIIRKSKRWGILSQSKHFNAFPKNIIAPLGDMDTLDYAFIDGLVATVTKDRVIDYFDEKGTLQYSFKPNQHQKMTLYDKRGRALYPTHIDTFKIHCSFARGVNEHFVDPANYHSEKIIYGIKKMLSETFTRYQIPNPLFEPLQRDPYKILGESDSVKNGRIWVLARGYTSESAWGTHEYLMGYEYDQFKAYAKQIARWITSYYGTPIKATKYGKYIWKIDGKLLKLETFEDTGDGDFYNLLVLEAYRKGL